MRERSARSECSYGKLSPYGFIKSFWTAHMVYLLEWWSNGADQSRILIIYVGLNYMSVTRSPAEANGPRGLNFGMWVHLEALCIFHTFRSVNPPHWQWLAPMDSWRVANYSISRWLRATLLRNYKRFQWYAMNICWKIVVLMFPKCTVVLTCGRSFQEPQSSSPAPVLYMKMGRGVYTI